MGMNNGDIARNTINLIITAEKITADVLKNAMRQYLAGAYTKRGKVSLKQLAKGGKIEGIEISKANIVDFRRTAAKYDIQYALSKCPDKSTYYVMFSSSKTQNIEKAFREYASGKVRSSDKQLFSRENQKQFREKAAELSRQNQLDGQQRSQKKEKVIEW